MIEQTTYPKPSVVVVIPVYKSHPDAYERISLDNCLRVLSGHPVVLIAPDSLNLKSYHDVAAEAGRRLGEERFADHYFTGVKAYNRLLISEAFWARFLAYEHLLIHQLDAFVFADRLAHFCALPYDYLGAPWTPENLRERIVEHPVSKLVLGYRRRVGNGGLSLRRVPKLHRLARNLMVLTKRWPLNEDVFWSLFAGRYVPGYRVAPPATALAFAIEYEPAVAYVRLGNQLPFGCHAWERYDLDFWRPFFAERGYRV